MSEVIWYGDLNECAHYSPSGRVAHGSGEADLSRVVVESGEMLPFFEGGRRRALEFRHGEAPFLLGALGVGEVKCDIHKVDENDSSMTQI